MKRILFFLIFLFFAPNIANAITPVPDMWGYWGYNGSTNAGGSAESFIIAGSLGKSGSHGTWGDEWAIAGIIASQITEHGGFFCPYQLQCANKRKKKQSWTMYYWPNGFDYGKCAWLCEDGYSGEWCQPLTEAPASCDSVPLNTNSGGKFSGISLRTSGGNEGQKESDISGFHQWGSDPECDIILGVIKFLEHGVIAAPVRVCCARDNWKEVDSYVSTVNLADGAKQKLLCAPGYKSNSAGTDCEPITEECKIGNMTFCTNFPKQEYNPAIHRLDYADSDCVKYFCSDSDMAFPSVGDTSCVECSTGVKGGANKTNGVCVKCETGEFFNQNTNACEPALAYSKTDMQYGKGQTKNTIELEKQCWMKIDPEEYKNCVKGIK